MILTNVMKELIINSLHCYINNLRILVTKFLSHYLWLSFKKSNEEFTVYSFLNLQFFIENYDMRNHKDRNKHGE